MPPRLTKTSTALTFDEWYAKPIIQPLTSSEPLGWRDLHFMTSNVFASKDEVPGPLFDDLGLIFILRGATRIRGKYSGTKYDEQLTPGSLMLMPPRCETVSRWSDSTTTAFITIAPQLLTTLAETSFRGDPSHVQLPTRVNFRDPLLHHLFMALYDELRNPGPLGSLFSDSVSQTIMLHLLRKYSNKTVTLKPAHAQLTLQQMRILNEYIEYHLDQKISLNDLAVQLHLSVSHFERIFCNSQGCSPYRYVLERRMERAKWLLQHSTASVYEVARQCGFANQSHFTRHFTRLVGVSPARYRMRLHG